MASVVVVSFVSLCHFDAMLEEQFSGLTFKVPHDVFPALWVEAGADEREDRDLLHLLFVSCRGRNTHTHTKINIHVTLHIFKQMEPARQNIINPLTCKEMEMSPPPPPPPPRLHRRSWM